MYNVRKIQDDIYWLGASDRRLEKFENTYRVPAGMSYNSYLILDEKTCLVDGIDYNVAQQFFDNLEYALQGRTLDYMIVNHMEPDHCAIIPQLVQMYPHMKLIGSMQAFKMMNQFYRFETDSRSIVVKENDTLSLGKHNLKFITAPMVHWPEVIVTYDETAKVLFSADVFGCFGAMSGNVFADEIDWEHDWKDECRRYYTCIVGKYGMQAATVLKKIRNLEIEMICPLHAHIWRKDFDKIISLYEKWTSYSYEVNSVAIFYGSVYNNTALAADILAMKLAEKGIKNVKVFDTSKTDLSIMLSTAFQYSTLVFAAASYNAEIFDTVQHLLSEIKNHSLANRTVGLIENGSWVPTAKLLMEKQISTWKNTVILEPKVTVKSAVKEDSLAELEKLADAIVESLEK